MQALSLRDQQAVLGVFSLPQPHSPSGFPRPSSGRFGYRPSSSADNLAGPGGFDAHATVPSVARL